MVDDNRVNQRVLKIMIQRSHVGDSLHMVQAFNGQEAVERYSEAVAAHMPFHLILMDCQMPVMNGFEATHAIRKLEAEARLAQGIPIVAVTANALPEQIEECLQCGMQDVLVKPFTRQQITQLLSHFLTPSPSDILEEGRT